MVAVMAAYRANVERDGRFWLIHVPEIDRVTQARHLREVDQMARELIAIMTDVDPESVEVDVTITVPADAREHLDHAEELRKESARANAAAAEESRAAARALADAGLPLRDVGAVMGVSHQRAAQLIKD